MTDDVSAPMADDDATATPPWEERIGSIRVFEHPRRKLVLYLRWRQDGNWAYHSLAKAAERDGLPTATLADFQGEPLTGRALERKKKWARGEAEAMLAKLHGGRPIESETKAPAPPLTLDQTWEMISNLETGQYPTDTRHRREVKRELEHAERILPALAWTALKREQLTKLWRRRIHELRAGGDDDTQQVGLRGAEITVSRVLAIATWLRDREHIPADAAIAPSNWRKELRKDWLELTKEDRLPEPARPRHTADDFRKLFAAAWEVDPRLGLMYALGAELRGGQIKRSRRSDLDLPPITEASEHAADYGRLRSPGRGKKRGAVVELTKGQRAAVTRAFDPDTGYLRELEAAYGRGELADYFLFPRGPLPGGRLFRRGDESGVTRDYRTPKYPVATLERHVGTHVGDSAVRKWFKAAELKAGIKEVKGRVWYGGRRTGVDLAKELGISREGLQEHGGWSDSQMPDAIYADKDRDYARKEAARVRTKIRGEVG